jgi:hypothetical protein
MAAKVNWTIRTPAANNEWSSVTYGDPSGNGLYVAVCSRPINPTNKDVMTSTNGITWISRTTPSNGNSWTSVTYGNGLFVAVSYVGVNRVMISSNGIDWTPISVASAQWYSVTYGTDPSGIGLFVAVAGSGTDTQPLERIMTSLDGITWTLRTAPTINGWGPVTYGQDPSGNGLFVAVGSSDKVMTSPDGITWTIRQSAFANGASSITYGIGLFVAVNKLGQSNSVMTSPDGINWTARTCPTGYTWVSVTYGNGTFVAVSSLRTINNVMTSDDGITWRLGNSPTSSRGWASVTYGNNLFIAVGPSTDATGPAESKGVMSGVLQFPCFKEDSLILTVKGYIPIQNLRKGDLVKTLKHGLKPIDCIGKREIHHSASKERIKEQLYQCCQKEYPEVFGEPLIITGCHSILVENSVTVVNAEQIEKVKEVNGGIYLTEDMLRLPACVDLRASVYPFPGTYTIYHLALENDDYYMNYGIYANGLLVETCSKRYLKELSNMILIE